MEPAQVVILVFRATYMMTVSVKFVTWNTLVHSLRVMIQEKMGMRPTLIVAEVANNVWMDDCAP